MSEASFELDIFTLSHPKQLPENERMGVLKLISCLCFTLRKVLQQV